MLTASEFVTLNLAQNFHSRCLHNANAELKHH